MSNWIFVVTNQKDDGKLIKAREIFETRMKDKFWGINEESSKRKDLVAGDRVLFYIGTPEMTFTGNATLSSPCYELEKEERKQLSHNRELFTADYGVQLSNIQVWDKPISVRSVLNSLNFVGNRKNWGSHFRGAIREISDVDYSTLTASQISPKIRTKISEPISGEKLYQQRARGALPLLVRQAQAGVPIHYSELAEELGMPNARNLNYVLGSIGESLIRLSEEWKEKIPPIQCLVINKNTGLPGNGIGWFLLDVADKEKFAKLSLRRKREIVEFELQRIFDYRKWSRILEFFSLEEAVSDYSPVISEASGNFGGGESERHRKLKEFVAKNPETIGLKANTPEGTTEQPLASGDCLDVSFNDKKVWIAAEVKSAISPEKDIIRGLFQCIKYKAVMEAILISEARPSNARALLVLESTFPKSLIPLRNILGVEVVEGVSPSKR